MRSGTADRQELVNAIGDVFRKHGFPGASLAQISSATGLGKGSLYHLFPDGKAQMAEVVLDQVSDWFESNVFLPLREGAHPALSIGRMFRAVEYYFRSGRRICLVGAFALDSTRERFAERLNGYFSEWTHALATALRRGGLPSAEAKQRAEEVVAGIQGALVLARARGDPEIFRRALERMQRRLAEATDG